MPYLGHILLLCCGAFALVQSDQAFAADQADLVRIVNGDYLTVYKEHFKVVDVERAPRVPEYEHVDQR
jgi:hypothetical protein